MEIINPKQLAEMRELSQRLGVSDWYTGNGQRIRRTNDGFETYPGKLHPEWIGKICRLT